MPIWTEKTSRQREEGGSANEVQSDISGFFDCFRPGQDGFPGMGRVSGRKHLIPPNPLLPGLLRDFRFVPQFALL